MILLTTIISTLYIVQVLDVLLSTLGLFPDVDEDSNYLIPFWGWYLFYRDMGKIK